MGPGVCLKQRCWTDRHRDPKTPPIHRQRYHMAYVSIPCTGVSYIWIFYIGYILKFYNQQSGLWGLSECTTDNICHHVLSENAIECNFERNRCNKLCHFERTQCMRCLPAQCEVLVPFYRLHPCGVQRTISEYLLHIDNVKLFYVNIFHTFWRLCNNVVIWQ